LIDFFSEFLYDWSAKEFPVFQARHRGALPLPGNLRGDWSGLCRRCADACPRALPGPTGSALMMVRTVKKERGELLRPRMRRKKPKGVP